MSVHLSENNVALFNSASGAAAPLQMDMEIKVEPDPFIHQDQSRLRKSKEDKICGVCGDRALGYNFDAISCESCKAFFRRNAPKNLEYFKCPYEEKCKMDVSNRRFCKRCRLRKCFEIGMRKEYILTEEEKARKRSKIEVNRQMRDSERQQITIQQPQQPQQSQPPQLPIQNRTAVSPEQSESCVSTSSSPSSLIAYDLDMPSPTIPLASEDQDQIEELKDAYNCSLQVKMEKEVARDSASDMIDLYNIAEISVRRVIDLAKKIKAFKALPQSDQIALLKGGSIELLIIRSVITYDKEKNHFLDPTDQEDVSAMNVEQIRKSIGSLFEEHIKFVRSLAMDMHTDLTTLILLLVISLFSPDRPNLTHKDLVSAQQEKYSILLKKYLESRYMISTARSLYPKLLMKLTDIRNLNEEHSQVLLRVNPEGMQPLMQEVLDIKNTSSSSPEPMDSSPSL